MNNVENKVITVGGLNHFKETYVDPLAEEKNIDTKIKQFLVQDPLKDTENALTDADKTAACDTIGAVNNLTMVAYVDEVVGDIETVLDTILGV